MYKNWHNIDSKVQLAGDTPEMTRGCRIHTTNTTMIAVAISDRVTTWFQEIPLCNSAAIAAN